MHHMYLLKGSCFAFCQPCAIVLFETPGAPHPGSLLLCFVEFSPQSEHCGEEVHHRSFTLLLLLLLLLWCLLLLLLLFLFLFLLFQLLQFIWVEKGLSGQSQTLALKYTS